LKRGRGETKPLGTSPIMGFSIRRRTQSNGGMTTDRRKPN